MSDAPVVSTRNRENTRARLREAAFAVFADVGMDSASVEAICERAGFTRGAFYSNFESKDDLFLELVATVSEQKLAAVAERVRTFTAECAGPAEAVGQLVDASLDSRQGVLLAGEIRIRAMRDERMARAYREWTAGMVDRVAALVEELVAAFGLGLRMAPADFALLMLEMWQDTAAAALIEGLDDAGASALMRRRTQVLAGAIVEGFADSGR